MIKEALPMRASLGRFAMMIAVLSFVLTACTNHEPQERAAFISKLQTQLIGPQVMRAPTLAEDEKKAIGEYAKHYGVITKFQETLSDAAGVMQDVLKTETLHTLGDIMERRQALDEARKTLSDTRQAIIDALAEANASRAKLKIPEDLSATYERAFAQTVAAPAAAFQLMITQMDDAARDAIGVDDFVKAHQEDIVLDDDVAQVLAPSVQLQLNEMLASLNAHSPPLAAAQQELQKFGQGTHENE